MTDRAKHPSGKPIRASVERKLPIQRIPDDGPLTPRLRRPTVQDAIGFHHFVIDDDGDDE